MRAVRGRGGCGNSTVAAKLVDRGEVVVSVGILAVAGPHNVPLGPPRTNHALPGSPIHPPRRRRFAQACTLRRRRGSF